MRRPNSTSLLMLAAALLTLGCAAAQRSTPTLPRDAPDTLAIVALARSLSHDSMRGRGPWTAENATAARALADELAALGARPLVGESLLVPFITAERPRDTAYNVIGILPSRTGSLAGDLIGITAHLDHLGVGEADSTGDTIYNGFLDDAIGCAIVLDVARRYRDAPGEHPLVVMFFNLEEQGLLGALALARRTGANALFPRFQLVVGVDAGAPAGEALEWELMGGAVPSRGVQIADSLARARGWGVRLTPPRPISDVYVFAARGVPILFPIPGARWKGYSAEERQATLAKFDHYHQPGDEWRADLPLVGTATYAQWLWEIVRGSTR